MKILIVTQWFDPEPTFKGLLFAKSLVDKGHEVEVITGFPNYPTGKIYDGYKMSFYQKEVLDGVVVHRVPLYPSHDGSAMKRILNYISFAASSLFCGLFKAKKPDVIYSYHPPLTTSLSALFIGLIRRVPFVPDIQDLWPDTLSATGMLNNTKLLSLVEHVCQFVYKRSSKIVVLSPGFKRRLISRGVSENKIEVIYNWSDEIALRNSVESAVKLPNNGCINLVFAGNLGFAQGLPAIVKAAEILQFKKIPINIVLIGDGVAKLDAQKQATDCGIFNVYFLPRVPMNEVGGLLDKADILLVHLTDDDLFSITIPSRTQAYLAMGKPIVMGVNGDASALIQSSNSGVCCKANSASSLAEAIERIMLLSESERLAMGERSKHFYNQELALNKGVEKFISVFEAVK